MYLCGPIFYQTLVCSSYIFDMVIVDDEYMHMFVECLIQYSSGFSGTYYVSIVLRYYLTIWRVTW